MKDVIFQTMRKQQLVFKLTCFHTCILEYIPTASFSKHSFTFKDSSGIDLQAIIDLFKKFKEFIK